MRYAEEHIKAARDFLPRHRMPTVLQFGALFAGLFVLMLGVFSLSASTLQFGLFSFLIIAGISALVTVTVQRSRDLTLATEYQNAIFTSALGTNTLFCLIIRKDGSILYYDRGVQEIFADFVRSKRRTIDAFLEMAHVSRDESRLIFDALEKGSVQRLLFSVITGGMPRQIVMTVDPIMRPSNFLLLRGRDYIGQRSGEHADQHGDSTLSALLGLIDQSLPVAVYIADIQGRVTYANANFDFWLGYGRGDLTSRAAPVVDLLYGVSKPFVMSYPYNGEAILRTSEGEKPVLLQQEIRYDSNGNPIGSIGALQMRESQSPVAQRATTPSISATTQGSIDHFIDGSPIAILGLDAKGHPVRANAAFNALTHGAFKDHLPDTFLHFITEQRRSDAEIMLKKMVGGELPTGPQPLELAIPDRQPVIVSLYANYIPHEREQDISFILQFIDITEQKNLELRFSHSQKMQAVGQLAGGVAHDFNNLLTAMIGFCDLLLMRHPAGDQSFADIMQIKQNANRAANLVRQLLAFSRRQTLQPKTLDITDVLAELSNLVRRLIGENIELKMAHGRDVGMMKADQGQLEQVIINLAVNARDAMPNGGTLTIRTNKVKIDGRHPIPKDLIAPAEEDSVMPSGEYLLVEVSDTGTGIPHDIIQKIFEPFFSTKEVGSGTGLGLSTVYGIIKQTGGYIFVSSKEGSGTTFNIYFPSYHAEAGELAAAAEAEINEKSAPMDLTGKGTILLVEDETPVRIFAARALRNKGYTVLEADCAETALELMHDNGKEVELIITDVIMPGMNGPTMVEKIVETYPAIKVIFISGYAEDIFMNSYGSERSFNFLAKPFTLKQLASKVKEVALAKV